MELPSGRKRAHEPGRQLAHAVNGAALLGQPVIEHRRDQGAGLDPELRADRGHERLQLGGEDHPLTAGQVVQRLDAERVAGQDEIAGRLVEQREREHAAEPAQRVRSPAAPGLEHDLGVRAGAEADTAGRQLRAQVLVVVQLAVVDERHAVAVQRLVGQGTEVDDR